MKEIAKALKSVKWKFSRRGGPHEYIREKDHPTLVHSVKEIIDREGANEVYHGYTVRYWEHEGYKYWVMPGVARYGDTLLILNRVELKPATINNFKP